MMQFLGVRDLTALSHMIHSNDDGRPISPSWVQVYRELMEWAVLFKILREKDFANDTIIVYDGLLRIKVFSGELFIRLSGGFADQISSECPSTPAVPRPGPSCRMAPKPEPDVTARLSRSRARVGGSATVPRREEALG